MRTLVRITLGPALLLTLAAAHAAPGGAALASVDPFRALNQSPPSPETTRRVDSAPGSSDAPGAAEQPAAGQSAAPLPPVPFLSRAPSIDGTPDPDVARTAPLVPLTLVEGKPGSLPPPSFRLAYTPQHLYLHVQVAAPELLQRDRAYQNGDGLIVVLAKPRPNAEPTDEFHVLGFSPGTPAARWQQKFVWYRNVDLEFRPLDDTRIATGAAGGTSSFEVLVPWSDLYPTNPWLSDGVGFNVCVTRALAGTASARYCLVEDGRVDSEQSPRRYTSLSFASPAPGAGLQAAAVLERNHVRAGETVRLRVATLAPAAARVTFTIRGWSGEGTRMSSRQATIDVAPGLQRHVIEAPVASLAPGGYALTWETLDGSASGRLGLTVLPADDVKTLETRLAHAGRSLAPGSMATLTFQVEEAARAAARLTPQDTAANLRLSLERLIADIGTAEAGHDPFATRTGVLRRAFKSAVDGTLQPYSIRVPAGYTRDRRYPLLVYLHGSGEDDRNQVSRDWFPADAFVLAPRARGTSNWYTEDHAQDDIREAIDDVIANYAVDPDRIVLSGFSMGGYGVYRTYKEQPRRFRALAIFSGIPRVPGNPPEHPDFLEREDLGLFRTVPMFIFHGGKDRNCPIEQTRAIVGKLEQAGAPVEFHFEADKGHEAPNAETLQRFREWMGRVSAPRR